MDVMARFWTYEKIMERLRELRPKSELGWGLTWLDEVTKGRDELRCKVLIDLAFLFIPPEPASTIPPRPDLLNPARLEYATKAYSSWTRIPKKQRKVRTGFKKQLLRLIEYIPPNFQNVDELREALK